MIVGGTAVLVLSCVLAPLSLRLPILGLALFLLGLGWNFCLVAGSTLLSDALAQQEAFEQMRSLIATLSPRRQEVITLKFYAGLRNREIARVLGLDERTVAAHLCRALRDLEQCVAPANPELATEAAT